MKHAVFRFYAELNDFLPPGRKRVSFVHEFELSASVKDMIEALGIPHTEVELILVNSAPVDFFHAVKDGERISIFPAFRSLDVTALSRLRPPIHEARFALDTHLGKLARYLRMMGFDVLYDSHYGDVDLSRLSATEGRIILTRDRGLLKRSEVTHAYFVRETHPRRQLVEVLRRFGLVGAAAPFRRCMRCNALLQSVSKESVASRLPPRTRRHYDEFWLCPSCGRVYWAGSHYQHMKRFIQRILAQF